MPLAKMAETLALATTVGYVAVLAEMVYGTRTSTDGCPWSKDTCRFTAHGGNLEALRYAQKHGCPWDKDTCSRQAPQDAAARARLRA